MNWYVATADFIKPFMFLAKRYNAFFYIAVVLTNPTQIDLLPSFFSCGCFSSGIESDFHSFRLFHGGIESNFLSSSLLFWHPKLTS